MIFQKSQPAETEYERLSSASTGPLKNMDTSSPAPKAHAHEMQKKTKWRIRAKRSRGVEVSPDCDSATRPCAKEAKRSDHPERSGQKPPLDCNIFLHGGFRPNKRVFD
jgi:hypothetical protein